MDLRMSEREREAFLAKPRIAIVSIDRNGRPPLAVPIWYGFDPDVGVWILTTDDSLKAKVLDAAGRYTLTAQQEDRPHRYVSVEGPVVEKRRCDPERDVRPLATHYVGPEMAETYVQATRAAPSSIYVMRPEVWRTMDQGKLGEGSGG